MFKSRLYMSGLGVGLIVGASLLSMMVKAQEIGQPQTPPAATGTTAPDKMDPAKLKEEASKYFQVFDKDVKVYVKADVDAAVQQALKSQPAPKQAEGKSIAVYVSQGLVASQVAELLYRSGVVADRNAFEKLLNDQQVTNKIQVGYHVFQGTPDPQDVIKTLTTSQ